MTKYKTDMNFKVGDRVETTEEMSKVSHKKICGIIQKIHLDPIIIVLTDDGKKEYFLPSHLINTTKSKEKVKFS